MSKHETIYEICFYCDMPIANETLEYDHFPIPNSMGGKNTVPSCRNCHTLKDRISIGDWLSEELMTDFTSAFKKMTPRERLVLAKIWSIAVRCTENKRRGQYE